MMTMKTRPIPTGRAKTVLVFDSGVDGPAVIASVTVRQRNAVGNAAAVPDASVVFAGSVTFDARTEAHIRGLVVPTAVRILAGAGIASAGFEIAVANLDATSAQERGARIIGYSMDAAILLAMLSESLGIPIHEDIVTTGHLASPDGRLAAVGSLPAKLEAAVRDPSTHRFLYPTPDGDGSMAVLSPEQLRRCTEALIRHKRSIDAVAIAHVGELLEAAFDPEQIVLASLNRLFFKRTSASDSGPSPVDLAVRFLLSGNDTRIWEGLDAALRAGDSDRARNLLAAFARFHVQTGTYPTGFGHALRHRLMSLPPATRRSKIRFPLLAAESCIALEPVRHQRRS
jgi:hypothetical protein